MDTGNSSMKILLFLLPAELTNEHYADIGLLLGYIPVESAEVPRLLKEIANEIYLQGKSNEFETVAPLEGMQWLEDNCISAFRLTKDFLQKHGHRSLKEVCQHFTFVNTTVSTAYLSS